MKYSPQLCGGKATPEQLDAIEASGLYVAEEKFDGIYGIVECEKGQAPRAFSRNAKEKPYNLPPFPVPAVFAGELAFGQQASNKRIAGLDHGVLWTFDILEWEGESLVDLPFVERRQILEGVMASFPALANAYQVVEQRKRGFRAWYNEILARKGEGLILKLVPGEGWKNERVDEWVKVKKEFPVDAVIMGVEVSTSASYAGIAKSLIIGQYRNGELVEIGRAGGLTVSQRKVFWQEREMIEAKSRTKDAYVGEFKAFEIFDSGALRHPSFVRLRDDKSPFDCKMGTP